MNALNSEYHTNNITESSLNNICCCRSVVCSTVSDSVTPWTAACLVSQFFTISLSLLKPLSIESVMPSNHLILCCPLLLLPSIFPSTWVFSKESALHIRRPKYWSFSLSISPSNDYSRLISFRIDWFDLLDGLSLSQTPHTEPEAS